MTPVYIYGSRTEKDTIENVEKRGKTAEVMRHGIHVRSREENIFCRRSKRLSIVYGQRRKVTQTTTINIICDHSNIHREKQIKSNIKKDVLLQYRVSQKA